nr:hypothetical protein [Tanacetum cinerariifolium]
KRTLILPLLSSYSCLLEAVYERLEIDANSRFMVTYNSDNDIVEDPQSDSANHKIKQVVGSLKHKKPSIVGKVKRLASKDESSEYDDESSESDEEGNKSDEDEETTPIENKNCKVDTFWSMPPLLKTPVLDIKKKVGAAIRTFVSHIRPLIIIDGAHLKGEFLGTMYLAVAMAGNNQILPLAYGVGKSETFRSWDWFLRKIKECIIGKQDNLTIISDGAVSIASTINNVFPNAFHDRCCRHLLMNSREKCPRFISKEKLFLESM